MERLLVNLPASARTSLRELAEEASTKEEQLAQQLLLEGLARLERRRWLEKAARAATPDRIARDVRMLEALDRWNPSPAGTSRKRR